MTFETKDYDLAVDAKRNHYSSWKKAKDRMLDEAWPVVNPSFQIRPGTKVFTIGSCFARNIEEHLQRLGFTIPMLGFRVPREEWSARPNGILNKYTPAAIFQEIEWARNILFKGGRIAEEDSAAFLYKCSDGSCIDTNLGGFRPVTPERFFQRRSHIYDTFKEAFTADCVVITLGLIEAWFDLQRAVYIQQAPIGKDFAKDRARFAFERLTHEQSCRFLQNTIHAIRDVNKDATFLITTSPVPMRRTFTDDDVIVANMYSKSLLRAVAGEIAASNKHVDYFPSYESVTLTKKWNIWEADLIHVSDVFVGKIVARLTDIYCPGVEETKRLLQQSYTELKADALIQAIELGRLAVERAPEDADLRKHLGELLARKGDLKEAQTQFARAISLKPEEPALHHQLSAVLARQGRFEEAVKAAHLSIALAPENEEFHRHLGRLWARKWRLGRAAIHFILSHGHRQLRKTKHHRLNRFFRFLLDQLQRMSGLTHPGV